MPVFKDEKRGTWYVMAWYRDWTGERKQKCKRGFPTKREAQDWERSFQMQTAADMDMTFEAFVELYTKDVRPRLKENTWLTKENIIQKKILPYFGKRKISEITTKDVIAWQNELLAYRDEQRKPYSQTYLKTLHNQLSAIFNHAVRFYELRSNPAAKAGNMGTEERKEMLFWTLLVARITPWASSSINSNLSFSSNCSTVRRRAWPRLSEVSLASPAVPVACKRPAMVEKRLSAARCTLPYSSR